MSPIGTRWCFTINNPTADDEQRLTSLPDCVKYLIFGREVGSTGTPHLQGFVIFHNSKRLNGAKQVVGPRAHLEIARGTSVQAASYCKKEGDFVEFGSFPDQQGKRNDFAEFKQWVLEQPTKPTAAIVAEHFPALFIKYARCMEWIDLIYPPTELVSGDPRGWQRDLGQALNADPDDRKIIFVVDPVGGTGKSWFVRWWLTLYPNETQRLSIGKRDDLAYAIQEDKRYFLFDVPRSQSEFLQYSVLEQLKDRMIFSPKYVSRNKILATNVHVVVFMNEEPDYNKLTNDRYEIIRPAVDVI